MPRRGTKESAAGFCLKLNWPILDAFIEAVGVRWTHRNVGGSEHIMPDICRRRERSTSMGSRKFRLWPEVWCANIVGDGNARISATQEAGTSLQDGLGSCQHDIWSGRAPERP